MPAGLASQYPGYDLLLSYTAGSGDPYAELDFSGFDLDGISTGQLGVADLGLVGVPEPCGTSLLVLGGLTMLAGRRCRRGGATG